MSLLSTKSSESIAAAQILSKAGNHSSSIHCAYYSCLQKMMDVLIEKYNYTNETLLKGSEVEKTGSHVFVHNQIFRSLNSITNNFEEKKAFKELVTDIKRRRIDADYWGTVHNKSHSGAVIDNARKISSTIDKYFNK